MAFSMAWAEARAGARDETDQAWEPLAGFRRELYRCFSARADALFELCDAALCRQDRVHVLAELSLEPGHQRGHGALYDALNCGKCRSRGCAGHWPGCRCRPGMMAGSGWRSM